MAKEDFEQRLARIRERDERNAKTDTLRQSPKKEFPLRVFPLFVGMIMGNVLRIPVNIHLSSMVPAGIDPGSLSFRDYLPAFLLVGILSLIVVLLVHKVVGPRTTSFVMGIAIPLGGNPALSRSITLILGSHEWI